MKKHTSLLLVLMLFVGMGSIFAQPALGFGVDGVMQNKDTVNVIQNDSVILYSAWVVNKGNATFAGTILFKIKYDVPGFPLTRGYKNAIIQPGDSIFFEVTDTVTEQPYHGGNNVLVIWPPSDNSSIQVLDTAQNSVHVILPGGTSREKVIPLATRMEIFPNPVAEKLFLRDKSQGYQLEYVRVMNLLGNQVYYSEQKVAQIDFSALKPGIYFLEAKYKDGLKGTFKLIHP